MVRRSTNHCREVISKIESLPLEYHHYTGHFSIDTSDSVIQRNVTRHLFFILRRAYQRETYILRSWYLTNPLSRISLIEFLRNLDPVTGLQFRSVRTWTLVRCCALGTTSIYPAAARNHITAL
jgi:hypothetical protein